MSSCNRFRASCLASCLASLVSLVSFAVLATDGSAQVIAIDFGRRLPTSQSGSMIDHAMAYDVSRRRTVAWDAQLNPGTIHEWNGASWTARALGSPIAPTAGLRAGYDPTTGSVLFFGGVAGGAPQSRQWRWNGASLFADGAQPPAARSGHAISGTANGVLLFGGDSGTGLSGDTWLWAGGAWTRLSATGPTPRRDHAMGYSYFEDAVYLFGGRDANGLLNDFWRLDLPTMTWAQVTAAAPPAPREHAELTEGFGGFIMLFGGIDARGRVLDEVHDYYVGLATWQARGPVVDCHRHDAIARDYARDEIVIHGGNTPAGAAETWTADPSAIANFPGFARSVEYGRGRTAFRISTDTNPVLGAVFAVDDRSVPAGALGTWLAFGRAGNRNDPLGLHLDPRGILVVAPYSLSLALPVPSVQAASGTDVTIQAVTLTSGGASLVFSNSMRAIFGTW